MLHRDILTNLIRYAKNTLNQNLFFKRYFLTAMKLIQNVFFKFKNCKSLRFFIIAIREWIILSSNTILLSNTVLLLISEIFWTITNQILIDCARFFFMIKLNFFARTVFHDNFIIALFCFFFRHCHYEC